MSVSRAPRSLAAALLVAGAAICGYSIAAAQTDVSTTPTERASAGKLVYQEKCARCHGDALEGRDHAPPLRGAPFRAQWHQKVARALYRRILSTMPLDTPGTLTPQETVSVVVYCLTQNGMRFDAQAIDSADSLNTIHIELTE